jgi:hypothetical protein
LDEATQKSSRPLEQLGSIIHPNNSQYIAVRGEAAGQDYSKNSHVLSSALICSGRKRAKSAIEPNGETVTWKHGVRSMATELRDRTQL